jgi:hypothetical protein
MSKLSSFSVHLTASASPQGLVRGNGDRNREHASNHRRHHFFPESILFLRIFAAADYFTLNTTLMETVPPVAADLILDPFLLNVFPRSLVPTAGWIAIVAATAWIVAGWIMRIFQAVIDEAVGKADHQGRKEKAVEQEGMDQKKNA